MFFPVKHIPSGNLLHSDTENGPVEIGSFPIEINGHATGIDWLEVATRYKAYGFLQGNFEYQGYWIYNGV